MLHTTRHVLIMLLLFAATVGNAKTLIRQASIYEKEKTLFVDVTALIDFPKNVKEAVMSGLTLTFRYEFELQHKAWYKVSPAAEIRKTYLVNYQRMTGKFNINNPVTLEHYEFNSLDEVAYFMENLRAFPLILVSQLNEDIKVLSVRFHLSNKNLPTYVSVDRIFNDNWAVDSDWSHWKLP